MLQINDIYLIQCVFISYSKQDLGNLTKSEYWTEALRRIRVTCASNNPVTPTTYRPPLPPSHPPRGSLADPTNILTTQPPPTYPRAALRRTRGVLTGRRRRRRVRERKKKIFSVTQILTHAFSYAFVNSYLYPGTMGRRRSR